MWPDRIQSVDDMVVKEIYPLKIFLERHGQSCENRVLLWLCDNAAASMIINGGAARNRQPNEIVIEILTLIQKYRLLVLSIWIPRQWNVQADFLSHAARLM